MAGAHELLIAALDIADQARTRARRPRLLLAIDAAGYLLAEPGAARRLGCRRMPPAGVWWGWAITRSMIRRRHPRPAETPPTNRLPFLAHLGVFTTTAVGVLAGAWALLHSGVLNLGRLTTADQLDIVKIALSIVAGVGGVIALTVSYRNQRLGEAADRREDRRLFNERFGTYAQQLSSDQATLRLAGAYAMAGLADDWDTGRQTCIDVLCAYLRTPYPPDPPPTTWPRAVHGNENNRSAIPSGGSSATISGPIPRPCRGHSFDFTDVLIDGADLHDASFTSGKFDLTNAQFTGGMVTFTGARFTGGSVDFTHQPATPRPTRRRPRRHPGRPRRPDPHTEPPRHPPGTAQRPTR